MQVERKENVGSPRTSAVYEVENQTLSPIQVVEHVVAREKGSRMPVAHDRAGHSFLSSCKYTGLSREAYEAVKI